MRTLGLDTIRRKPSRTCSVGPGKAEPPRLCGFRLVVRPREPRAHPPAFFTSQSGGSTAPATPPSGAPAIRFCAMQVPVRSRLLDLDEVTPFALTALDTQIVGASANAVECCVGGTAITAIMPRGTNESRSRVRPLELHHRDTAPVWQSANRNTRWLSVPANFPS